MYTSKQKFEKLLKDLNQENKEYVVYFDMKFAIKDACNPYQPGKFCYLIEPEIIEEMNNTHKIYSLLAKGPVHFVYSFNKIDIPGLPTYKKEFYEKYFDSDERKHLFRTTVDAFKILKNEAMIDINENFLDSSLYNEDELSFIKRHFRTKYNGKTAIVVTRDESFYGYSDIIALSPKELASGELAKGRSEPAYNKIILSMTGIEEYSIPGVPGVGKTTAMKIIKKIIDNGNYIYYIDNSSNQRVFPISYSDIREASTITELEYNNIILKNWDFLNR